MTERFNDRLRSIADPTWSAQHAHPFVRCIGDGTLGLERFGYWIRQDYRFLIEYCRLFALGASRSPDLATLTKFAELLRATAVTEMSLHRELPAGLTNPSATSTRPKTTLAAVPMVPICRMGAAWTAFTL